MSQRIFLRVAAPSILISLLLLGAALASVWSINRLQQNLAQILSEHVASLEAAQELEIRLRQLRFNAFMYVLDPTPERQAHAEQDHAGFEAALEHARRVATLPEEAELIQQIQTGYRRYRQELARGALLERTREAWLRWAEAHPVRHLVEPCQALFRLNKEAMEKTARESESVSRQARTAMLVLGVLGPVSGLIGGIGIARGLSRQMHQAEQFAALGRLAAGVAHEVRNPLTSIKLLVGSALRDNGPPLSDDDLRVIHGEIARLEQTVQNLLDFARPAAPASEPSDLREAVRQSLGLVRTRAHEQQVEVIAHLPDTPVEARIDRGQFRSVLVNLLLNALDAMPSGGRVEIALGTEGGEARLTVRDTGPGIDPSVAGRLFVPFVSAKPTGTGLGLSNSKRVLEDHGGRVSAANHPEGGACFTVMLPLCRRAAEPVLQVPPGVLN